MGFWHTANIYKYFSHNVLKRKLTLDKIDAYIRSNSSPLMTHYYAIRLSFRQKRRITKKRGPQARSSLNYVQLTRDIIS